MKLISVQSVKRTAIADVLDLMLTADLGSGDESLPFTYSPNDPHGLAPVVATWLASNPGFAIADYVAPPPPDLDAIDTATLNDILLQPGSVARTELKRLFNHENRMRALEGKAAITKAQFVTALKIDMRNGT